MISVLRSCHGFRISDGVHPFGSYGRLARCAQPPDCCWTVSRHECEHRTVVFADRAPDANRRSHPTHTQPRSKTFKQMLSFEITCENARQWRAQEHSTTNVVLLEQSLVARLVPLLHIVEERAAGRDQLQEAATRMVVLHVGLEMAGEVVDA